MLSGKVVLGQLPSSHVVYDSGLGPEDVNGSSISSIALRKAALFNVDRTVSVSAISIIGIAEVRDQAKAAEVFCLGFGEAPPGFVIASDSPNSGSMQ